MKSRENKMRVILEKTISIIEQEGVMNLSMRKVAGECGLTLSNLQYYYPDKTELLQASAEYFFAECENQIISEKNIFLNSDKKSAEEFLKKILELLIIQDKTQTHTFFREFWVLAIRDEAFDKALHEYYSRYARRMIDLISESFPYAKQFASLLIPFAEGYSLLGKAMPMDREQIIELFYNLFLKYNSSATTNS